MGYIIKNTSGLINTRLTDTGRLKLSQGSFNIAYFQVGDSEVSYNTLPTSYNQYNTFILEPSFNAQNSAGAPQSNKENVKYPFYVDGTTGNTYGIPFMDSIVSPVYNRAIMRGFFDGDTTASTITWSARTNNLYALNSNYVIQMNSLNGGNTAELIYNGCNPSVVRSFSVGDFITIFFDGNGLYDCSCSNLPTPTPTPTISVTPSNTLPLFTTPTPTSTSNPCGITPTPSVTPSATFCPTPTPSRACPPPPPPDCLVSIRSCYAILTYRIIDVCLNTITLDRNLPDYSFLNSHCYARTIIYPPNMTTIYDTITPSGHWNESVINFESVCYTDEFDVKIWNMNIPWSENPAGLNPSTAKNYTDFGSIAYLGSKEYFGYSNSSGQTDTSEVFYYNSFDERVVVEPEEQKTISLIHYTNQTVDLFYGEKFALQPFDDEFNDTTGQARNFKFHLPWIMWHKNPECCFGQTFWVDPPGFENISDIFKIHYLESNKNSDMNDPGHRYYHLWDNNANSDGYPSRVGKVFPDAKVIVIDDEEIVAAMSYKSNRNWTLPAPKVGLITPNTCGNDNTSVIGLLTGETEYLHVTYRLTNTYTFTNSLHSNYYSVVQGPNVSCNQQASQNVSVRFGAEFNCLSYPGFVPTTTTTTILPPCYFTGFTLATPYLDSSTNYTNLFFEPTGEFLNGQPIFSNFTPNGLINIFWDGSLWKYRIFGGTPNNFVITFSSSQPLGNFTINDYPSLGLSLTGFNSCIETSYLCSQICVENEPCIDVYFQPVINITTNEIYYQSISDSYSIEYSTSAWRMYSGATIIAANTSVNQNDYPIGTYSNDILSVTSVTVNLYSTCVSESCDCTSFTADTSDFVLRYINCNRVIQDDMEILSGNTFSACTLTLNGDAGWNYIDGDPPLFEACLSSCITTTTTTIAPITTTTTTICPICDVTSGFYADKFEIICQKVIGNERPNSAEWRIIDFTSQLSAYTINGFITQQALTANTFVITQDLYENADLYDLTDYINLSTPGLNTPQLNFGDEYYFYGNLETDIQATIYEMRYKVNLGQVEFTTTSNPTWTPNSPLYVSEIGLYDNEKNLMILSKMQSPVLRQGIQQFLVKFDF